MWQQSPDTDEDGDINANDKLSYGAVARGNTFALCGYSDWHLPDIKGLKSIVDYSRPPDTKGSAAIDPLFYTTLIVNEAGQIDYPF